MSAQVYYLSPKGSAWLVYYRLWKGGGCTTHWAFVFNHAIGLTAYEAWELAKLPGCPAFYEVITTQLSPFQPSVDTNGALKEQAFKSLEKLSERVSQRAT
jgi:hypothetical protein